MKDVKEWYAGLGARDQRVLLIGVALALVLLVYGALWSPLVAAVEAKRAHVAEQEQALSWMQTAAGEVQRLRQAGGGQPGAASSGVSLMSLVDRTAKAGRLGGAVRRVKPEGENLVQIWFEQAPFDDLMPWLESLRRDHRIAIDSAVIERLEIPGLVNARLVLKGRG